MKKPENPKDTLRRECKPSDFPEGLVRGKYAKHATTSNLVAIDPGLTGGAFPDSASVNDALRAAQGREARRLAIVNR